LLAKINVQNCALVQVWRYWRWIMCGHTRSTASVALGLLLCLSGSFSQFGLAQTCLEDDSPSAVCNSNDVTITNLIFIELIEPCTYPGDTATVRLTLELQGGAQDRYDIGMYIAQDGGDAATGSCAKEYLPPPLFVDHCPTNDPSCYDPESGVGPFYTAEPAADTCGDLNGADATNTFYTPATSVTITCVDNDDDGFVDVGTGAVWSQQASNGGNKPHCTSAADALPGTNSKCSYQVNNSPYVMPSPALSIDKTSPTTNYSAVGDIISYSYLVTNTGNVALSDLVVNDDVVASVSCPDTSGGLAPGGSITCAGTYTVTQADIDSGSVTNTASATDGNTTSPTDSVTVNAVQNPALTISKSGSPSTYAAVGDVIDYTYQVTNAGNVTLFDLTVSDDLITVTCPDISGGVAPGVSVPCTASYTITQADLDSGSVTNNAFATDGSTNSPADSETVTAVQSPALTIDKTTSTPTYDAVGDVLQYSYQVTNSGNVTLFDLTVSDDLVTVTCPDTSGGIAPGASVTCTASHTITQSDLDAGSVTNTATATDGTTTSPSDSVTATADLTPALTLAKSASPASYSAPGEVISYQYLVTNSGNVSLTDITVSDDLETVSCPDTSGGVAPGNTVTCTASHTITQADLDAGSVTNTATASSGATTSAPDSETVTASQSPALTLAMTATPTTYSQVGDVIGYSYQVTNTGNITLPNITVSDDLVTVTCPDTSGGLAPRDSVTCTASYTITQADIDNGTVTNTATASSGAVSSAPDSETVTANQNRSLAIDKSTSTPSYSAVGDVLQYSYEVTNTGNTTLGGITVTDDRVASVSCPVGNVAPGDSITCTGSYAVTQADVDAGSVTNTAFASSGATDSPTDSVTINASGGPGLSLSKSASTPTYDTVGQVINYSYLVTNSGNTTISGVTVTDDLLTVTCPGGTLDPGDSETCTASHTVTQADLDAGSITNTATASDGSTTSPPDSVTVTALQNPSLSIDKSSSTADYSTVGQTISYSYDVTNTGNVTLPSISVTDDRVASVSCPGGSVAPSASITCTGSYDVTQADLDAGSVANTATASSGATSSAPDSVTVPAVQNPAMTIVKTAVESSFSSPGDTLNYSYQVTNSGNVTLSNISVTDDKASVTCPDTSGGLAPTASITCTAQYTVTQADLDAGSVTNTASASDGTTDSPPDSLTVDAQQNPALDIQKTADPTTFQDVGDVIDYDYDVTNSGNATIFNITVTDDLIASVSCPDTSAGLAPGDSITCTGSYTIAQLDLTNGSVTNTAFATDGTTASTDVSETVTSSATAALTISKSADQPTYTQVGETIDYSYEVTNTGDSTLFDITVSDDRVSPVNCPDTSSGLAPGATITCTGAYAVTQPDLDAGSITNVASATDGTNTSPTDSETVTAIEQAQLSLVKTPSVTEASRGDTIVYTYEITNTGNVTIDGLELIDDILGPISLPSTTVAPGDTVTVNANHTVGYDDFPGPIVNNATASGDTPQGLPVTTSDTASVTLVGDPGEPPTPPVEAIPTLGEWGIMLLFALLTFFGIGRLYRRQEIS
jgi:uncharacterized repeat protein (TIGR01451 family)